MGFFSRFYGIVNVQDDKSLINRVQISTKINVINLLNVLRSAILEKYIV